MPDPTPPGADQPSIRPALGRRLLAEFLGTGLLVAVVIGSGIAAQRLSPGDTGLQLLQNSLTTVFGLGVLILLFGPVSGAHFNPVVSAVDWLLGRRAGTGLTGADTLAYTAAQILGGIAGAALANIMFELPPLQLSEHARTGVPLWIGEIVATAGLIAVIVALARTGRAALSAVAVAAWIGAAYWFTSSTSFANPAVTIARMFSDTFAGISPASTPMFVLAQIVGAALGTAAGRRAVPGRPAIRRPSRRPARPAIRAGRRNGYPMTSRPQVLFVCVHNAGRSQMAAALLKHHADGAVDVRSAGSEPADTINPAVRQVMAEIGIDLSTEQPKKLTTDAVEASDVVITMGCGDACPIYPGKRYLDWQLTDPAGKSPEQIRPIRDEIATRVQALIAELGVDDAATTSSPHS